MDELTAAEYQQAVLSRLDYGTDLLLIAVFALCCIAASGSFQIILYAARNKNFWGCIAFVLSAALTQAASAQTPWTVSNIVWVGGECMGSPDGLYWRDYGTCTFVDGQGTSWPGAQWSLQSYKSNGQIVGGNINYGPAPSSYPMDDFESYQLGFWPFRTLYTGQCVTCPPVDSGAIGFNCCANGKYGATWYIAKDNNDCDYLACNNTLCQSCPELFLPPEGTECPCEAGQKGVTVYTYDLAGCPNGTMCDDCEACPEIPPESEALIGTTCTVGEQQGMHVVKNGPDGCPYVSCDVEAEIPPCELDSDRNGTPDYLDGNPYTQMAIGQTCSCAGGGPGSVALRDNPDGCSEPFCMCDQDECTAGDKDEDGCCDDEDPDPDDAEVNCESCDVQVGERITALLNKMTAKIMLPSGGVTNKDWTFDIDLGSTLIGQGIAAFGVRFGGNLTQGTFWIGQPNTAPRPEQEDAFATLMDARQIIRMILSSAVYLVFSYSVLGALFNPAR